MGNTHTKEERIGSRQGSIADQGSSAGRYGDRPTSRRPSRPELGSLGLALGTTSSSSRQQDAPFERRETRQEREARKLEKERAARIKERERSMKEEHVDGGFLVTMGVYTGIEDFNKIIVRQLQIERKIAPFWRGLDDFKDTWAEHQIVAAARGLEIPPPDEVPEHLVPQHRPSQSPDASAPSLNNLTVPLGSRTFSASSDRTGSQRGSALPSPTSPVSPKITSPLKQPKKALAAALSLSRNGSQVDIAPREVNLPNDPFVNGQPMEVFLYKEGEECPLCLMYYPPYLNRTRCCCQVICSECFVQIKRPDPHPPDHHDENPPAEGSTQPDEQSEDLIMEPAKCPYCTQTDFGVTYDPPPFRRGLTHAASSSAFGAMSTAMSSSSSINSMLSPTTATPPSLANRKRAQSLSANAPGVVTTDRIRPDWSARLAATRAHRRRRAAAADALHHAAFVIGPESRTIFGRSSRFSRRPTGSYRGTDSPTSSAHAQDGGDSPPGNDQEGPSLGSRIGLSRERIDAAHLENLMMAEAIRLSLADEEERRKKADKEAKKEAKKRQKEERKAAKKRGEVYGGSSSASASSLSLGLGRRRGNSNASNLRVEASVAAATASALGAEQGASSQDKGKGVDRGDTDEGSTSAGTPSLPIPTPQVPRGASHLRQMSNASSISSSGVDTMPNSYTGKTLGNEDPRGSGLSLSGQSDQGETVIPESLFNFRSLAEVVGVSIDGDEGEGDEEGDQSRVQKSDEHDEPYGEHFEHVDNVATLANGASVEKVATPTEETSSKAPQLQTHLEVGTSADEDKVFPPPDVIVTPETPAPLDDEHGDSKRLGHFEASDLSHEVTQ
ncbi:hypothetical protein F5Y16DRAFT_99441 [Xylariaceae sp. FL0255]|nr:hypothetical protein F5Y16DRAFT_99441 [Xylariaceae sp. FL0255]